MSEAVYPGQYRAFYCGNCCAKITDDNDIENLSGFLIVITDSTNLTTRSTSQRRYWNILLPVACRHCEAELGYELNSAYLRRDGWTLEEHKYILSMTRLLFWDCDCECYRCVVCDDIWV